MAEADNEYELFVDGGDGGRGRDRGRIKRVNALFTSASDFMEEYNRENKESDVIKIVLPASVVSLDGFQFEGSMHLENVDLGKTCVTKLGGSVFRGCTSLQTFASPEGLIEIHDFAFNDCGSLRTVIFPDSLKKIGSNAFSECDDMKEVNLRDTGVTEIGQSVFARCSSLATVIFPDSLEYVGKNAFYMCNVLKEVNLRGTCVTEIGRAVFAGNHGLEAVAVVIGPGVGLCVGNLRKDGKRPFFEFVCETEH